MPGKSQPMLGPSHTAGCNKHCCSKLAVADVVPPATNFVAGPAPVAEAGHGPVPKRGAGVTFPPKPIQITSGRNIPTGPASINTVQNKTRMVLQTKQRCQTTHRRHMYIVQRNAATATQKGMRRPTATTIPCAGTHTPHCRAPTTTPATRTAPICHESGPHYYDASNTGARQLRPRLP